MKSIRRRTLLGIHIMCCTPLATTAFNAAIVPTSAKRSSELKMHESNESNDVGTSRRSGFASFASALATYSVFVSPSSANAAYGADANIQMPNIAQGLADRANKQCLVESLGNRECLVYEDPDNKLYQAADSKLLFERLGTSVEALNRLPGYITNKQ